MLGWRPPSASGDETELLQFLQVEDRDEYVFGDPDLERVPLRGGLPRDGERSRFQDAARWSFSRAKRSFFGASANQQSQKPVENSGSAGPSERGRRVAVTPPAPPKAGSGTGEAILTHLMGARCLLSLWILADHFIHRANVFTDRANVAVDGFILMSGFVTQWANSRRDLSSWRAVLQFYLRRIGRVMFTTYLAMAAAAMLMTATSEPPETGHLVRCLGFVESWLVPETWCPNGQTWTIAALLPSWLLYPLTKRLLSAVEAWGGSCALVVLGLTLWLISVLPSLFLFCWQGGWLTSRQHNYAYVWPPSQLPDFAVGMVAAQLARHHRGASVFRGLLSDLALALVLVVVLALPSSGYHVGWEPLLNHGLAPLLALFLYESSACNGKSLFACLMRQRPLPQLGAYSFEVFLFQQPLYSVFQVIWIAGLNELLPIWTLGVVYLVVLYGLSALYAEKLEAPFVEWLRSVSFDA